MLFITRPANFNQMLNKQLKKYLATKFVYDYLGIYDGLYLVIYLRSKKALFSDTSFRCVAKIPLLFRVWLKWTIFINQILTQLNNVTYRMQLKSELTPNAAYPYQ